MPTNWPPSPVLYSSLLVFLFRCSHTDPVIHRHYLHTYTKTALDSVGKSKWTQRLYTDTTYTHTQKQHWILWESRSEQKGYTQTLPTHIHKNSTGFSGKVEVNTKVIHRHYLHTYTKNSTGFSGKVEVNRKVFRQDMMVPQAWKKKVFWETFKLPFGSCISFEEWIGFQNRLVDAKRFWKMPYGNGGFKITNYFIQWQQTFMIMAY